MKTKNYLAATLLIYVFLGAGMAKAQFPGEFGASGESGQSDAGGATAQTLGSTLSNPVAMDTSFSLIPSPPPPPPGAPPGAPSGVAGTAEASFQAIYSRHVQVYRLPLSYAFTDNLKMEMAIPFINKTLKGEFTGEELSARGLGDISFGAKYRYGDVGNIQGMTSFYLKLPTGQSKQFENRQEQLALGTGSYDFIINQTVMDFFGDFLVIANVGYTFNTKNNYTETSNFGTLIRFENRAGNVFNYMVGAEYYTPVRKLVAYLSMAGLILKRSHIKETNLDGSGFGNIDEDRKDRLRTLDLIAGVKYMFTEKTALRLGFIAPALTSFDPDAEDTEDRDWLLDFGFAGRF